MNESGNYIYESPSSLPAEGDEKTLEMIFIVDNSGSMRARINGGKTRMEAVNDAFGELVPNLQKKQRDVAGAFQINISILLFNQNPQWAVYSEPVSFFVFNDLPVTEYVTYYSRAYGELKAHLSRTKLFNKPGKKSQPYIMLMTDGAPTEGDDYLSVLNELSGNGWFVQAERYALLIGDDVINDPEARVAVGSFVKDERENIIDATDTKDIIEAISGKTLKILDGMTQLKRNAGDAPSGGEGGGETPSWQMPGGSNDDFWRNFGQAPTDASGQIF